VASVDEQSTPEPASTDGFATPEPPLPTGAFFEAAFRRFGQRFLGYELWTVAALLIPGLVAVVVHPLNLDGPPAYGVLGFGYALGHFALVGTLAVLVTGAARRRAPAIATAAVAGAIVAGALCAILPPLAVLVYPPLAFAPIAAAAGDADGLRALPYATALVVRSFGRIVSTLLGLVTIGLAAWFGFVIALTPLGGNDQKVAALTFTTLLVWPLAALVMRNVYGDLTGRVVLRREELAPERVPQRRRAR
jgi:hypothetical protein